MPSTRRGGIGGVGVEISIVLQPAGICLAGRVADFTRLAVVSLGSLVSLGRRARVEMQPTSFLPA